MMNLKELHASCMQCHKCELSNGRTNVVFGEGNLKARVMFIGEGPGHDEDMQGRPFVGKAGQLLTKMIEAIDLKREDVYIANIVKCRPPNNRVPLPEEAEACLPYLRNQVAIIRPSILVCLGSTAARYVIDREMRITRDRGKWIDRGKFSIIGTYHPAALLRDPDKKREAWEDFKKIRDKYMSLNV
ncbi:uracil DNA glycosylase superfamily protein [Oxobacter pfennigii]|uniref:Type-4 uracil-DNA glycosylase n=1 Tax=Oxobacter pfennigii TaxID=36849 RepID=A0A0P8WMJ2_9CLOT|nr:uracil-DNA glycosylase [Oxobacter pfennigii]KPU43729.1 uracil DNA glycosylase superfamily protein [Oxobacter pfennigii]